MALRFDEIQGARANRGQSNKKSQVPNSPLPRQARFTPETTQRNITSTNTDPMSKFLVDIGDEAIDEANKRNEEESVRQVSLAKAEASISDQEDENAIANKIELLSGKFAAAQSEVDLTTKEGLEELSKSYDKITADSILKLNSPKRQLEYEGKVNALRTGQSVEASKAARVALDTKNIARVHRVATSYLAKLGGAPDPQSVYEPLLGLVFDSKTKGSLRNDQVMDEVNNIMEFVINRRIDKFANEFGGGGVHNSRTNKSNPR